MRIVTSDIGGTHARFAIATIVDGRVAGLGKPTTLKTGDHASFETALEEFARATGAELPNALAIAFAGPVGSDILQLTNSPWVIRPARLGAALGVERFTIVNDFGAVAHAAAVLDDSNLRHICGPEAPLPASGVTTVVGPGTGLGVAILLRDGNGECQVVETEGGHVDFAPLDALEERIVAELRATHRRVSVERIVSGRGLVNIYQALGAIEGRTPGMSEEKLVWEAALCGTDNLAAAALDRLCLSFGAVTGDLALAQGANAVIIGGGLGLRLADHLPRSGFCQRFLAKGRFERRMAAISVKLITHPQPGLLGAAVAFAREHR